MEKANLYIAAENQKAITHFKERGCEFFGSIKYFHECCSSCGEPYGERKILYVEGDFVKGMSGTQFHKYLKEHDLLL